MKLFVLLSTLSVLPLPVPASSEDNEKHENPSPDGKFVFQFFPGNEEAPFGVIDAKSQKTLWPAPENVLGSFQKSAKCVWADDSKHFALNIQAGGRYEVTLLYRWDGKKFIQMPDVEPVVAEKLKEQRDADMKKEGVPLETYQRRIWDKFTVTKWIDGGTIEMVGYSSRVVTLKVDGQDEGTDFNVSFRLKLTLTKKGAWKILSAEPISEEEVYKAGE